MTYYGDGDQTLGQFLEEYVSDAQHSCHVSGCQQACLLHYKVYVHGSQRVTCILEQFPCPVPGGHDRIYMWSYCKVCESPAKHTVMNEQTWSYSFAKYLELSFYPSELGCRTISPHCEHNPHRDHVRYFALRNLAVRIYSDHVDVNDVAQPPLKLKIRPDVQLRLRSEEMDRILAKNQHYWNSVSIRLSTFNFDLIPAESHEEARALLENMHLRARADCQRIEQLLFETHRQAKWSSGVALNVVLRSLQERVVEWDIEFSSFEQKFVPTEKDIRRLTSNQLKRLFDTGSSTPSRPTSPEMKPNRSLLDISGASTPFDLLQSMPPSAMDRSMQMLSEKNLANLDNQLMDLPGRPHGPPSTLSELQSIDSLSTLSRQPTVEEAEDVDSDSTVCADPAPSIILERRLSASSSASEDEGVPQIPGSKIPRRSALIRRITGKKPPSGGGTNATIAELVKKFDAPGTTPPQLSLLKSSVDDQAVRAPVSKMARPPLRRGKSETAKAGSADKVLQRKEIPADGSSSPVVSPRPFKRSLRSRGEAKGITAPPPVPSPGPSTPATPAPLQALLAFEDGPTAAAGVKRKPPALTKREAPRAALSQGFPAKAAVARRSASAAVPNVQPGRVSSIAKHFDRISREAERERQKRLQVMRSKRARPVGLSQPTLEVYTTVRMPVALRECPDHFCRPRKRSTKIATTTMIIQKVPTTSSRKTEAIQMR
jgi:1-phosphatidylinositol-3-phosphate 5-kinase